MKTIFVFGCVLFEVPQLFEVAIWHKHEVRKLLLEISFRIQKTSNVAQVYKCNVIH